MLLLPPLLRPMLLLAPLLLLLLGSTTAQLLNHPPHFVPGTGDMSRFSLSEHTPVGSPVYQLKGKSTKSREVKRAKHALPFTKNLLDNSPTLISNYSIITLTKLYSNMGLSVWSLFCWSFDRLIIL